MSLSDSSVVKPPSSTENYFSIAEILATQQRIPCQFEVPVFHLGYLDPASDADTLAQGTKLELPYWLARALCGRRRHTVSIDIPKQYKEVYREIFSADASVVDLYKLGPYFYTFGGLLLMFEHLDSPDIAVSLLKTFQGRFRTIMDCSQNAFNEDTTSLTEKLDEMERALFKEGQRGLSDFQRWETRQTEKLTTSEMVISHRKRKRAQMEDS